MRMLESKQRAESTYTLKLYTMTSPLNNFSFCSVYLFSIFYLLKDPFYRNVNTISQIVQY